MQKQFYQPRHRRLVVTHPVDEMFVSMADFVKGFKKNKIKKSKKKWALKIIIKLEKQKWTNSMAAQVRQVSRQQRGGRASREDKKPASCRGAGWRTRKGELRERVRERERNGEHQKYKYWKEVSAAVVSVEFLKWGLEVGSLRPERQCFSLDGFSHLHLLPQKQSKLGPWRFSPVVSRGTATKNSTKPKMHISHRLHYQNTGL